jgi:plastocyanin
MPYDPRNVRADKRPFAFDCRTARFVRTLMRRQSQKEGRMRTSLIVAASGALLVVTTWGCGGGGYDGPSSPTPSPNPSPSSTISIAGDRGSQSFTPNPASVQQGQTVAWRNNDGVTHRILLNDGSLDTGNIAPGATSAALRLATDGANYHCSIHPTMVGSISRASGTPPPCTGPYCD